MEYIGSQEKVTLTLTREELETVKTLMVKGLGSIKEKMGKYQDYNVPTMVRNSVSNQYNELEIFVKSFARY